MKILNYLSSILLGVFVGCNSYTPTSINLIQRENFEFIIGEAHTGLYTITNDCGITMQITNYGSRIVSLFTPDRNGHMEDIVLGHDNIYAYVNNTGERFLGAAIGRYGNRIANGRFILNDSIYQLSTYNNGQCLHGGDKGFDRVIWNVDSVSKNAIFFSYLSPNGEEGFPGNLNVRMSYILTKKNVLRIEYFATTDQDTPINLTHHSFFNLKGAGSGSINNHILTIAADSYTPIDSNLIPTGTVASVDNTPFDFRNPTSIGRHVNDTDQQLFYAKGYDHNFILNRKSKNQLEFAASVYEPEKGRIMEVWTTEPAIQFYGGNFFDGNLKGKGNKSYDFRSSFTIETQHFPDSPNHKNFPSTILKPTECYHHICEYRFSCL